MGTHVGAPHATAVPRAGGRRRFAVTVGPAGRLRCDARGGVAPRNSLRERCSLRSNRRGESEHEGRCARRPRSWPCRPRRALRPGRSQGTSRPPDGSCPCSLSRRPRGAPPAAHPRHGKAVACGAPTACPCKRTLVGTSSMVVPRWFSRWSLIVCGPVTRSVVNGCLGAFLRLTLRCRPAAHDPRSAAASPPRPSAAAWGLRHADASVPSGARLFNRPPFSAPPPRRRRPR